MDVSSQRTQVPSRQAAGDPPAAGTVFDPDCPARIVLDHVTGRWGVLILRTLAGGPVRFAGLRDRIGGISEKMLSQTLRTLARDGLVERTVEPTTPPQVSYSLTALGAELTEPLGGLVDWIARRAPEVIAAQEAYDARSAPAQGRARGQAQGQA
ncbi:winged helix-turn-helix transcriptional regulator [Nocardiopsis potens]|uniref:winged helix-turn-helix transcriptional regulator n=1 Tax=Nocardiopsis potens TaxID=1246458 RepID=UPI00034511B5|nr:helix-turn-helix domain-containing protein [Nocardiopsis potens]